MNSLPTPASKPAPSPQAQPQAQPQPEPADPVLCHHCGRTARNGLVCIGMCVADSGY